MSFLTTTMAAIVVAASLVVPAPADGQRSCPRQGSRDGIDMCEYESHNQMLSKLKRLEDTFPNLARVQRVGTSVKGKSAQLQFRNETEGVEFFI